jgi:predicted NBD/HSP70 family sugar kinase
MLTGKPKFLKRNNRRLFLNLLRNSHQLSVAEISEKIHLSKTTVMKTVDYYVEKGYILPVGKGASTEEGGKKPSLYMFNRTIGYVFSVQIFPHEIYSIITDLSTTILAERSVSIRENETLPNVMDSIAGSFNAMLTEAGIEKSKIIGIAIGNHGITDSKRGISLYAPHFPSWGANANLKKELQTQINKRVPVYADNQIRFQVFAEKIKGTARNNENIILIEGGEGLVAGIIVKNRIKRGVHGLAGEIGHMILNPFEEETCVCGGKGCFEVLISVNRLLEKVRAGYDSHRDSLIFSGREPEMPTPRRIFDAANAGDTFARTLLDEVISWFAIGISNLILTHDPEIIIIHGIYTQAGNYFLEELRKRTDQIALTCLDKHVEIAFSTMGKNQGVIGGAAYVVHSYFEENTIYDS